MQDLIGQCGHYSERVRLDAIHGLTELLQKNPGECRRHALAVISAAAERSADADPACRAAQRDLLSKALLPALGKDALQPFIPVLMGHICAAMTHLAEPIRADALKLLEVVMEWRADLVASQYLTQVLHHFADALARPTRGRSLKAGSLAALLSIVTGLHGFLAKALPHLASSSRTIGFSSSSTGIYASGGGGGDQFPKLSGQQEVDVEVLAWRKCLWPNAATESSADRIDTAEGTAARSVLDLLLEAWGECSPGELSTAPDLGPTRGATAILQCCNLLLGTWGPELAGPVRGSIKTSAAVAILEKVAVHFPVNEPSVVVAPPLREQLVQLNVAAAQLLVYFLPGAMSHAAQHAQQEPAWVNRLLNWLQDVMATGTALPLAEGDLVGGGSTRGGPSKDGKESKQQKKGGRKKGNTSNKQQQGGNTFSNTTMSSVAAVPAAVYGAALTAVREILSLLPSYRRREMLAAAWALWNRTPVKSGPRAKTLSFFSSFLANPAETLYTAIDVTTGEPLVLQEEAAAWVAAMPRFLWELGASAPATTAAGLHLILDAARFSVPTAPGAPESPLNLVLAGLQPQLTPLFGVLMPPKLTSPSSKSGTAAAPPALTPAARGQFVAGPLSSLSESIQWLAIDVLYHLPGLSEATLNTTAVLGLGGGNYPVSTALRLIDIASLKAAEAPPAQFWGALLSMMAGKSRSGIEKESQGTSGAWERHEAVVEATCRAAIGAAGPKDALKALGPPLVESWKSCTAQGTAESDIGTAKILYGLLGICSVATACEGRKGKKTIEKNGERGGKKTGLGGGGCIIAVVAGGAVAKALPEALLAFVKACILCADADPAVHAAPPRVAAAYAAKVVFSEPGTLLGPTLAALAIAVEDPKGPRAVVEASLLLLLELVGADSIEVELLKVDAIAERAVKGLKLAVESRVPGLSSEMHKLIAMISQKLGKDMC